MEQLAVSGYAASEVIAQLHMSGGGREVSYRYELLDKDDKYICALPECTGKISHNSAAEIKRTAQFVVKQSVAADIDWYSEKIKPYYRLKMPDGGYAEWALGIYMANVPKKQVGNIGKLIYNADGYDSCQILKEDKLLTRTVVAVGTLYTQYILDLLNSAGISKTHIIASALAVTDIIEFEPYTTKLAAVNTLLAAINYNSVYFDAQGYAICSPYVEPAKRVAEYEYRTDNISILRPGMTRGIDMFALPNVFVRYTSDPKKTLISTYTNDVAGNPLSTVSRGRKIVDAKRVENIADQTTLDEYTRRQAIEASRVFEDVEFKTATMPHHANLDCLYVEYGDFLVETLIETEWSMELKTGGEMIHKARKVVNLE